MFFRKKYFFYIYIPQYIYLFTCLFTLSRIYETPVGRKKSAVNGEPTVKQYQIDIANYFLFARRRNFAAELIQIYGARAVCIIKVSQSKLPPLSPSSSRFICICTYSYVYIIHILYADVICCALTMKIRNFFLRFECIHIHS